MNDCVIKLEEILINSNSWNISLLVVSTI